MVVGVQGKRRYCSCSDGAELARACQLRTAESVDKASQINLFELSPDSRSLASPAEQEQTKNAKQSSASVYSSDEEADSVMVNPCPSTCERDSGYSDKVTPSEVSSQFSGHDGVNKLSRSVPSRCVR